jgi:hypothetical protein
MHPPVITRRPVPGLAVLAGAAILASVLPSLPVPVDAAGERHGRSGKISPDQARALCGN